MSLVRHIAGIPTATEQRCIRCCEVIRNANNFAPAWPGSNVIDGQPGVHYFASLSTAPSPMDCTPYDDRPPLTVDGVKEALEILKREIKAEVMEHPERAP